MGFPTITSPTDIWSVLQPFRLTLSDQHSYDWMLWLDVQRPNPHYFVVSFRGPELYELIVDG